MFLLYIKYNFPRVESVFFIGCRQTFIYSTNARTEFFGVCTHVGLKHKLFWKDSLDEKQCVWESCILSLIQSSIFIFFGVEITLHTFQESTGLTWMWVGGGIFPPIFLKILAKNEYGGGEFIQTLWHASNLTLMKKKMERENTISNYQKSF